MIVFRAIGSVTVNDVPVNEFQLRLIAEHPGIPGTVVGVHCPVIMLWPGVRDLRRSLANASVVVMEERHQPTSYQPQLLAAVPAFFACRFCLLSTGTDT